MATREIKTRFRLEGEQAYRKAMTDAANAVKVLKSEQKLAAAEFEASGDAQEYAAEQARILKEEIEHQKKAVAAAEEAVRKLTEKGVEPSSREMQTWKTRLNNAKTELAKMEGQLDKTEKNIKTQNSATAKAATVMKTAESKVKALTAEEALAEAQLKNTGDREEYLSNKVRITKNKIDEQKKSVEAAESAIKDLTAKGVDPASEEMQTWETKLLNAKTQLEYMETQLDETEAEMREQNSATAKAATVMKTAENKVKALTAEEALAEAQLKNTGDREAYLSDKVRITKNKIDEQKKSVEAAESAIKDLTSKGVDPASEEMQTWETKLLNAKTQLEYMETQLGETEAEMREQNSATAKAATVMKTAESKVKSLNAEEKLAEEQYKATGDRTYYLSEKTRILKLKLDEQKKSVKAAEDAIKELTDKGMDPAGKEVQDWKDKLVAAKTQLKQTENRLNGLEGELKDNADAMNTAEGEAGELKDAIEKVGEKVDYQNVISGIDSITGHMESVVKAAARAAKAVWEMGVSAGDWADELATAANEAGLDVETYQSWVYASRFIDTSVSDIVRSWQDIQKNMKEGNTDYLASLAKMGIATRTSSNKVRESSDIFWDMIDYLHNIGDESLRAEKATELFGNDWRKLNPLITAGSKAYKDMAQEGMGVAVVSEKNVKALGEVDDAVEKFQAQFDTMKYDALAALAPTFKTIAEAMGQAVAGLNEFIASEEGQKALGDLNAAVSGLINSFLGEDNGQGTFASIVDTAKEAVKKLTDALNWMIDHGDAVKGIVYGLAGAYAALKVSKTVLTFMQLMNSTPLSKLKTVFGGGGSGDTTAPTTGDAGTGGTTAPGRNAVNKIANLAGRVAVPAAVVAATVATANAIDAAGTNAFNSHFDAADDVAAAQASGGLSKTAEMMAKLYEALSLIQEDPGEGLPAVRDFLGNMTAEDIEALHDLAPDLEIWKEIAELNPEGMAKWLGDMPDFYLLEDSLNMLDQIGAMFQPGGAFYEMGQNGSAGMAEGIEDGAGDAADAAAGMAEGVIDAAEDTLDTHSPSRVFETIGGNAAVGLANGIYDRADEAIRAALWMANEVQNIVTDALQIHSPSKAFERLGEFTGLGFAEGIERSTATVDRAVNVMMGATARRPAATYGGMAYGPGGAVYGAAPVGAGRSGAGNVHVTMVLDKDVIGDVMAPIVNGRIGAKIQATRR